MRVGFFRRTGAFIIDAVPIFMILSLLLSFVAGDILKSRNNNFDEIQEEYASNVDEYYATLESFTSDLEDGAITQAEFDTSSTELDTQFNIDNEEAQKMILIYYKDVLFFFIIGYAVISYIYNLITKGQTFGRKLLQIELVGKVTWYTLFLRDLLWKTMFWISTLFIGLLIDVIMVSFTKKKKTLRDYISGTQIIFKGTSYPF